MLKGNHAANAERKPASSRVRDFLVILLSAVAAALFLKIFVADAYRIPSRSMEDTLLPGDLLLVNKFIYGAKTPRFLPFTSLELPRVSFPSFENPRRGDILVFWLPGPSQNPRQLLDQTFVKRCVAVSGDTVDVTVDEVWVNRLPVGRPGSAREDKAPSPGSLRIGRTVLGPSTYFVLGDNRSDSYDSRYWGCLSADRIIGKAVMIYWSWEPPAPAASPWERLASIRWERIGSLLR